MTMIELSIVVLVLAVLMVIAAASLLRARMAGNEGSARATLRTIHNAQIGYAAGCGRGAFATSLVILGTRPPGSQSAYLNIDLSHAPVITRSGYNARVGEGYQAEAGPLDCNNTPTQTSYYAGAVPTAPGETGDYGYAINQRGALWRQLSVAPQEPFGPPAELLK